MRENALMQEVIRATDLAGAGDRPCHRTDKMTHNGFPTPRRELTASQVATQPDSRSRPRRAAGPPAARRPPPPMNPAAVFSLCATALHPWTGLLLLLGLSRAPGVEGRTHA